MQRRGAFQLEKIDQERDEVALALFYGLHIRMCGPAMCLHVTA